MLGCSLTGYAVMRALARKNLHVIGITYSKRDVAQLSQYVSEVAQSPDPADEKQFVACLIQNADRWAGALILETADNAAIALSNSNSVTASGSPKSTPDLPSFPSADA